MKDLEEAAHVGALELVGKIDGEGDGGHGVLGGAGAVADPKPAQTARLFERVGDLIYVLDANRLAAAV